MLIACASSPTNIAVIKYWGKRDKALNLPINSSLSVTLHQDDLCTLTSVAASKDFEKDRIWLNGVEEDVPSNKRILAVFKDIREMAGDVVDEITGNVIIPKEELKTYKVHVVSKNSFPTAAGLASSASGYACLVQALAKLFRVTEPEQGALTRIARQGSGSASRSLYGGYVKWEMGTRDDGKDSIAIQVASEAAWPSMHALICVVSDHKKTTSSTGGMIDSVNTSELLGFRAREVVPKRMVEMEKAIQARDFETFANLTMKDSNQFHATCLDTFPPIQYMNDTSHAISRLVHEINSKNGTICCYTFDAGPNAVIFVQQDNVETVKKALLQEFGPASATAEGDGQSFVRGQTTLSTEQVLQQFPCGVDQGNRGYLKYMIHTRVGPGATNYDPEQHPEKCLIDASTGLPKQQK